jgi:hypothetical protein
VADTKQVNFTQRECDLLCHVITGVLHGWAQSNVQELSEDDEKELRALRAKLAGVSQGE